MKHFHTLMLGVVALGLASCSNVEEPVDVQNPDRTEATENAKDVFATLTIKLPSSSAAGRAANGEEFGKDPENNVGKILVVLATKDENGKYGYLTSATADAKYNSTSSNQVKYVLNFASKDMRPNALGKDENGNPTSPVAEQTVYVFAYCNPTTEITNRFNSMTSGSDFTEEMANTCNVNNINETSIWKPNQFLMTNSDIPSVEIPSRDELVNKHNTPETALSLGTVKVKRVVARFDFKTTNNNKYNILDIDGETKVGEVELTHMAMFNVAKHFFYLPCTSNVWNWEYSKRNLCGDPEMEYVISCNTDHYKNPVNNNGNLVDNYRTHFYYNLIGNTLDDKETDNDRLEWVSINPDEWKKREEDWNEKKPDANDENDNYWNPDTQDYRIWRYATENTIPESRNGANTSSQKVGITTGVVFKGAFHPVNTNRWNGNAVYVHNNIVYGDYATLEEYVKKNENTSVAADFKKVDAFKNVAADYDHKKSLLKGLAETQRQNFKAYEPEHISETEYVYPMYYFYYNRHLSNGNNSLMGENEFGVVRNNVYKLAVTKCGRLGEPESTNKPDDPDEEENAYFTVSCLVMPWTVRVNNIEF